MYLVSAFRLPYWPPPFFFTRPIAAVTMFLAIGLFVWPLVGVVRKRLNSGADSAGG